MESDVSKSRLTPFGQTLVRTTTIPHHTECGPATTAHNARLRRRERGGCGGDSVHANFQPSNGGVSQSNEPPTNRGPFIPAEPGWLARLKAG